jgi:hypothetical protein
VRAALYVVLWAVLALVWAFKIEPALLCGMDDSSRTLIGVLFGWVSATSLMVLYRLTGER